MITVRGVDGCPAGWISLSLSPDGGKLLPEIFADAQALLHQHVDVTAIDIPIGLSAADARRCDQEARALLGVRKNAVFPAPVRATLAAESYEAACRASEAACGRRLSQQTYGILSKIRDVDAELRRSSVLLGCVRELHPEVCFYFWNAKQPMHHPKKTGFGFMERFRLVEGMFGAAVAEVRDSLPRAQASDDDILDAFAALWTAKRIHAGIAERVPALEECDEFGLPMQMWA